MPITRVRGTRDILDNQAKKLSYITNVFKNSTRKAGYQEIVLPSLEESSLYSKSLGNLSDIALKEMFYIKDRTYVLRPEGTAGALRAYLMNCSIGEKKLWSYCGSMFRHEKPSSGRYREFNQFGVENIGTNASGLVDAEVICIAHDVLSQLNVDAVLNINTIGNDVTRKSYEAALKQYFAGQKLSELSKKRLEHGSPLRILDSKEEQDQEIIVKAPIITDYLSGTCKEYYDAIKDTLKYLEVEYIENPRLVRGLDYYSNVCFEFIHANKALIGGGRYDNLGNILDETKNIGGIGWGAGLDRILEAIDVDINEKTICIVPVGPQNTLHCIKIAKHLRAATDFVINLKTDAISLKQHLGALKKHSPKFILFLGDEEHAKGNLSLKNCTTGLQQVIKIDDFLCNSSCYLN
jgi:histidyl-tRNA synthetase